MARRHLPLVMGLLLLPRPASADAVMTYVHPPPESKLDQRYIYQWEILKTALERTKEKYGPYAIKPSEFMTEARQAYEMTQVTEKLTVMYLGTTPELEAKLIPVRIPVDKNLAGYRIFLIRREDRNKFKAIRTLDDLRRFTYGLGFDWVDVRILRASGFKVVTGSNYDGLFEMLVNRRFDIFLRAAGEITGEYDARQDQMPDLAIEDSIVLSYTLPMYFWFPKTPEGRRLAARVEAGMGMMIHDGTYDRIFDQFQREKVRRLDLRHRKIFKIDNPFVGPETPLGDKRLWFDPATYP